MGAFFIGGARHPGEQPLGRAEFTESSKTAARTDRCLGNGPDVSGKSGECDSRLVFCDKDCVVVSHPLWSRSPVHFPVGGFSYYRNSCACSASPTSRLPWRQRRSVPFLTSLIRLLGPSLMIAISGCLGPAMSIGISLTKTSL